MNTWTIRPALTRLITTLTSVAALGVAASTQAPPASRLMNPTVIAQTPAVEMQPSLAPDGRTVAYQSDRAGNWDIWVSTPGTAAPTNVTGDHQGLDQLPRSSPDGQQVLFASNRPTPGLYLVPRNGGAAAKVTDLEYLAPAAWSADGTQVAYPRLLDGKDVLEIRTMSGGATRQIGLPGRVGNQRIDLNWSADGQYVVYVDARNYTAQVTQLRLLRLADGRAWTLGDGRANEWSPSFAADSRTIYFASNRGGSMDLWRQRIADDGQVPGSIERLTTDLVVQGVSVSRDRVAYMRGRWVADVWRVPILSDRVARWPDARQVTTDRAHVEFLSVSPDSKQLMVSSDRSGNPDIWVGPASGGPMQQVTKDPSQDWKPAWSPDGRSAAYYSYRSGNREVWVQPISGGNARQLTRGDVESINPSWSPDGRTIAFSSRRSGPLNIWLVPVDNPDSAKPLTTGPGGHTNPAWSPDGRFVLFAGGTPQGQRIQRVAAAGGQPEVMGNGQGILPVWSRDGKAIFFLSNRSGRTEVWTMSPDGTGERQLTDLTGKAGFLDANAIDSDGTHIYVSWREDTGDIWIAGLPGVTSSRH